MVNLTVTDGDVSTDWYTSTVTINDTAPTADFSANITIDKVADYGCSLSRWLTKGEYIKALFARQAIPVVWDFAE